MGPGDDGSSSRDEEFRAWVVVAWPRLVRTATALTAGDHYLAEDLAQTTLTRTYLAWGRIRTDDARGEHPDRYAHQILVRAFIDETRKPFWKRERWRGSGASGPYGDSTFGDGVFGDGRDGDGRDGVGSDGVGLYTVEPDDALTIRAALADLPVDQRAAVVLRHWLGYDVDETARLLDVPAATVRSRTFRGLARLRTMLGPDVVAPQDVPGRLP